MSREKKSKGQIRGSKGAKYYQSNKATAIILVLVMGCRDTWFGGTIT